MARKKKSSGDLKTPSPVRNPENLRHVTIRRPRRQAAGSSTPANRSSLGTPIAAFAQSLRLETPSDRSKIKAEKSAVTPPAEAEVPQHESSDPSPQDSPPANQTAAVEQAPEEVVLVRPQHAGIDVETPASTAGPKRSLRPPTPKKKWDEEARTPLTRSKAKLKKNKSASPIDRLSAGSVSRPGRRPRRSSAGPPTPAQRSSPPAKPKGGRKVAKPKPPAKLARPKAAPAKKKPPVEKTPALKKSKRWMPAEKENLRMACFFYAPRKDEEWADVVEYLGNGRTVEEVKKQAGVMGLEATHAKKKTAESTHIVERLKKLLPNGKLPVPGTVRLEEVKDLFTELTAHFNPAENPMDEGSSTDEFGDDSDNEASAFASLLSFKCCFQFFKEAIKMRGTDKDLRSTPAHYPTPSRRAFVPRLVTHGHESSAEIAAVGDDFTVCPPSAAKLRTRWEHQAAQFRKERGIRRGVPEEDEDWDGSDEERPDGREKSKSPARFCTSFQCEMSSCSLDRELIDMAF
ncbi:hypothetical protein M3Y99_01502400 [Aphelenchoides fujianensis]|nr:hypothetical protein M3Y99_01502400 [Aphelenchoides fujianensis]